MSATILVVESHPDLRAEIIATLARKNIKCDGVRNGADALLKVRDHEYHYIVLDVDAVTGGSLLYDDCADKGTLAKLVLLTDAEETAEMPPAAQACSILRKPFDSDQLVQCVK